MRGGCCGKGTASEISQGKYYEGLSRIISLTEWLCFDVLVYTPVGGCVNGIPVGFQQD